MIHTEKFKIGIKDTGKNDKIKNKGILELLENTGGYHSDLVGYGINDIPITNLSWILLDWKLEIINRPKYGQELTINTWGRDMNRFFTYRDYEIYNQNNELCVKATSKWALVDVRNRKLARITQKIMDDYDPEEKSVFNEREIEKIQIPKDTTTTLEYKVIRKDIDLNGHMHNLYYIDLAYEALPEDVYEKRPFNNVIINYKKEIKLGDTIVCNYAEIDKKHIVVIKNKNEEKIHAVVELF